MAKEPESSTQLLAPRVAQPATASPGFREGHGAVDLRRQLQILAGLFTGLYFFAALIHVVLRPILNHGLSAPDGSLGFVNLWSLPTTFLMCLLIWWTLGQLDSSRTPVARFRAIEIVLIATLIIRLLIRTCATLWNETSLVEADRAWASAKDREGASTFGGLTYRVLMPWALYAFAYGLCVPNRQGRQFTVIGVMVGIPLALLIVAVLQTSIPVEKWSLEIVINGFLLLMFAAILPLWYATRFQQRLEAEVGRLRADNQKLGQYAIGEFIGGGGFGRVYRATHPFLPLDIVMKQIHVDKASCREVLKRFTREAKSMARLVHASIVRILDYGIDPHPYLVMDFIPGFTLTKVIEREGGTWLPARRAIHILRQLCSALRELCNQRFVHRDIKPNNIILSRNRGGLHDRVTLLDFGLVVNTCTLSDDSEVTGAGMVVGTRKYMAPEQKEGGAVSDKTDVHSVASLGCFLLTGRWSPTMAELRDGLPSEYRAMEEALITCTKPNPADRLDANEFDQVLANVEKMNGMWTAAEAEEWWQRHGESQPTTNNL